MENQSTPPSTPSFTSMTETESSITISINSAPTSPSKTPSTISENINKDEYKPDGVLVLEMEDNKKVMVTEEDFENSFKKKQMRAKPVYRLLSRNICIGVICIVLAAVIALIIIIVKVKS